VAGIVPAHLHHNPLARCIYLALGKIGTAKMRALQIRHDRIDRNHNPLPGEGYKKWRAGIHSADAASSLTPSDSSSGAGEPGRKAVRDSDFIPRLGTWDVNAEQYVHTAGWWRYRREPKPRRDLDALKYPNVYATSGGRARCCDGHSQSPEDAAHGSGVPMSTNRSSSQGGRGFVPKARLPGFPAQGRAGGSKRCATTSAQPNARGGRSRESRW